MHLPVRLLALATATLLANAASAATWVVPVQGSRELTLALPQPATPAGDPGDVARRLAEIVEHDLDLTGYYVMVPTPTGGVEPGAVDLAQDKARGAVASARTRVLPAGAQGCDAPGGGFCVDVYVYDVLAQGKLVGRRVRAGAGELRAAAHEVASSVHEALVGERGFFFAELAAVQSGPGGSKEIAVLDVDGARVRPASRNASVNLSPSWSRDGRRLAWTSFKRGNPVVYVKDLRTGGVQQLGGRHHAGLSPAFSPNGDLIAVARAVDGETDLFLLDANTGAVVRQLTTGGGIDVSPAFTPDGRSVVFSSERGGTSSIYGVSVDGGQPWRITPFPGRFTDPVVSPDGKRVAFVVQHGGFDVWACDLDGGNLVQVTNGQGDNEDPTWSPDSRYLVFSSSRSGRNELWISTANGRYQARLTTTGGWSQPSFRPR